MIRTALLLVLALVLYRALKTVFRSAAAAYRGGAAPGQEGGESLVQDPNCRMYIVKTRAFRRRIKGETVYFCGPACADEFERTGRRLP